MYSIYIYRYPSEIGLFVILNMGRPRIIIDLLHQLTVYPCPVHNSHLRQVF